MGMGVSTLRTSITELKIVRNHTAYRMDFYATESCLNVFGLVWKEEELTGTQRQDPAYVGTFSLGAPTPCTATVRHLLDPATGLPAYVDATTFVSPKVVTSTGKHVVISAGYLPILPVPPIPPATEVEPITWRMVWWRQP